MYDINMIKTRLSTLRKQRWSLYKENKDNVNNPSIKYAYCKSQDVLAREMGLERRTIGSWEKGDTIPSLDNLIKLSELLDCTVEYFLGMWDSPEISTITKASHYSGISPEIIRYGLENPNYLDCLNYFMLPENCASLFNDVTLSVWKNYWINNEMSEIKNPLRDTVKNIFEEFNAITPFNQSNKENYKAYLKAKLPEKKLVLTSKKTADGINIKSCLIPQTYFNLISSDRELKYNDFIDYLADYTYEPLMQNALLEIQQAKLSKVFLSLFRKYLSDQ